MTTDYTALADELTGLAKRIQLDPLGVVPTYRAGCPETEGNIDGWMVCEFLKDFADEPHTEDPFAIGLSRNAADIVALTLNALPTLTAALREAERLREVEAERDFVIGMLEHREARRLEILDYIENKIGTGWTCENCNYSTYHQFAKECADCGTDFPLEHVVAFKLGATASEDEAFLEAARDNIGDAVHAFRAALKEPR